MRRNINGFGNGNHGAFAPAPAKTESGVELSANNDPTPWLCQVGSHRHRLHPDFTDRTAEDCGAASYEPRPEFDPTSAIARALAIDAASYWPDSSPRYPGEAGPASEANAI